MPKVITWALNLKDAPEEIRNLWDGVILGSDE